MPVGNCSPREGAFPNPCLAGSAHLAEDLQIAYMDRCEEVDESGVWHRPATANFGVVVGTSHSVRASSSTVLCEIKR